MTVLYHFCNFEKLIPKKQNNKNQNKHNCWLKYQFQTRFLLKKKENFAQWGECHSDLTFAGTTSRQRLTELEKLEGKVEP